MEDIDLLLLQQTAQRQDESQGQRGLAADTPANVAAPLSLELRDESPAPGYNNRTMTSGGQITANFEGPAFDSAAFAPDTIVTTASATAPKKESFTADQKST